MSNLPPQNLLARRVPQYAALYVGGSWGFVQFVSFLEERYLLSPYLTDLTLFSLALLLPSVLLFAYHHGRKGADRWHRSEKIGIPLNVAVAAGAAFLVFGGRELGALTTTKLVTDESGNAVEREVVKSEFRKRIAIFNFDGPAQDTALAWLRYGLPAALTTDLSQDMFLDLRTTAHLAERLREAGYAEHVGVPVALMRQLARDLHLGYFVAGTVRSENGTPQVTVRLYDAERGHVLAERAYTGPDPLALVDEVSVALRRDLGIPETYIEERPDLPVAEMLTASLPAFRDYVAAAGDIALRNDYAGAIGRLEAAVERDPTFASAHQLLYLANVYTNHPVRAVEAIQAAMDHIYKLPERAQFVVKASYYTARQQEDRSYGVVEMWAELYPDDIDAHATLAQLSIYRGERDAAIASFERILELDPTRYEVLKQIGQLHEQKGEFDEALDRYRQYADRFPDDADAYASLANLYRLRGMHDEAAAAYGKALLLKPGDAAILADLANLETTLGEFDAARRRLDEALEASRTAEDRARVYRALRAFHEFRGELAESVRYRELELAESERFEAPLFVLMGRLGSLDLYVRAGRTEVAAQRYEAIRAQLVPPWDAFIPIAEMELGLAFDDPDRTAAAIPGVEQLIEKYSARTLLPVVAGAKGRVAELRGDCAQALTHWREQLRLAPTDAAIHVALGRCQRERGELDQAEAELGSALAVIPAHPEAHYELALVAELRRDAAAAERHLRMALEAWANADPVHEQARLAREKLAALGDGGP